MVAPGDTLSAISEANVREAMRAMRFAKPLDRSPLLGLAAVDAARSAEGLDDRAETRAWLLQRLMSEAIEGGLARARGVAEISAEALGPAAFLADMDADYLAGEMDREAWSMLALRHVVEHRIGNPELAERLHVTKRTVIRRLGRGYALLAEAVREREYEALRARSSREGRERAADEPSRDVPSSPVAAPSTAEPSTPAPTLSPQDGLDADLAALRSAVLEGSTLTDLPVELVGRVARRPAADLDAQRLGRVATWLAPRYQLDTRFVALTLLIDRGEATPAGRWQARPRRYDGLAGVLDDVTEPALVVLGAPGGGKSTLLRRLELDSCRASLRGEQERVTLFATLSGFASDPGEAVPAPREWLGRLWTQRHPRLPELDTLLGEGRMLLLLDGLNEIPHESSIQYRERVLAWKRFVQESLAGTGNRAVFSCRSLDYSAPLSTPELRVPQVRIEPLDDEALAAFAKAYGGDRAWRHIARLPHRDLLRTPYLLRLLIAALAGEAQEATAIDPAALLTGYVRRALRREVERDHPALVPGAILTERDVQRVVGASRWRTPYELPTRGPLVAGLERLAHGMQATRELGERAAVQTLYDEALDLVGGEAPETIVSAGLALAVLDEDRDRDELLFFHQLIQEYFAARRVAETGEVEHAAAAWRREDVQPSLERILEGLGAGEPLPPLPGTVWSQSMLMAAAMVPRPADFVSTLVERNLVLAARAAALPEVATKLPDATLDALRDALVRRSRDPEADLRARFAAGRMLGRLGDPRFERHEGPHGACLLPPMAEIPGGTYLIGDDEPLVAGDRAYGSHQPAHRVPLASFAIGRFAVTNAEWACFVDAGGYEEERWWEGERARAWWCGEGTDAAGRENNRAWRQHFLAEPDRIDHFLSLGTFDEETAERWRGWCALDEAAFEAELDRRWPGGKVREPRFWRDRRLNQPSDPVVGICWYEARAYCAWLAATCDRPFRLPTEVEWEVAARGPEGRRLPYGDEHRPLASNTMDAHLFGPSPIGIFPEGDSWSGVSDLNGNTWDWTSSAYGRRSATGDIEVPDHPYPYDPKDGREDPELPTEYSRVARGGAWNGLLIGGIAFNRNGPGPLHRADDVGLRVAMGPGRKDD